MLKSVFVQADQYDCQRYRVELLNGTDLGKLVALLNDGFAVLEWFGRLGVAERPDPQGVLCFKDASGQPDLSRVLAVIHGTSGFDSGRCWRIPDENLSPADYFAAAMANKITAKRDLVAENDRLRRLVLRFENWADEMPCLPFNIQNANAVERLGELRDWEKAFYNWRELEPKIK